MRTTTLKLLLLGLIIAFTSCQKEVDSLTGNNSGSTGGTGGTGSTGGTNNTNNIVGDYDFVGMSAHTQSSITVTASGQEVKSITTTDYVTKNNGGTAKFTSTDFITTDLTYSVDTVANLKMYIDNVLLNDTEVPIGISIPPTSDTSPYTRISADSITTTGAIGVSIDPSGTAPTGPVGIKLAWSGDTLLLKMNTTFTQSVSQNGIPAMFTGTVNGVIKLKKR